MTDPADRVRAWRARRRVQLAAEWNEAPELRPLILEAVRAPDLLVWQSIAGAAREWATFHAGWAARGLRLPPTPDQYAILAPFLVLPGAGAAAVSAMADAPRRGLTYRMVGAILATLTVRATTLGAWAADTLARLAGRIPRRRRRTPSPASPSPVTASLASSPGRPVDDPRVRWHPPAERPPGAPTSLADVMADLGLAAHFLDRTER